MQNFCLTVSITVIVTGMDITNAERQKRHREKVKALREAHEKAVTGGGKSVTELVESVTPVTVEWDKEKYPERKAWEIAVVRVERAKRYAEMFPNLVHGDDIKFQTLEWQYENEGLPSIKVKVTMEVPA